ncbi:glutamyl-tRNA reductase [Streptoalloteichus tenebrarius]|uniref:Glutamyl-tRNA reductase n=1 Tax=Streptoalloteichus tenebrarius (strain ATCC 17920 / DSM 40477 / JCM 4838 / CBS 697.72 / NBRC 16177 / NCIMB 11028 / NRRL B-12390 / A12253. 1 / ISP 5477) TaxID=1933 RepID=A0ABT1I1R7_STRSD|nr:glutamyl-tRNA reductase [Streptoalloteichus tenebrarius]MCP2261722.1 glutamyl-tRNA reductase [Streptoalloteichus tenebrarius]BFF02434.1 glutamyl-tRNA reductase [Streptoalloteichus tenebrarius]
MSLLAVGMSHRTAPVRVLERVAVSGGEVGKLLGELLDCPNVGEAVLLSTCNRVEVYAAVEAFHGGLADITGVLARHAGCDVADLVPHLYVHYAGAAAEHLFSVAAGLDSMVVGEAQILGQLRAAYAEAEAAGTTGRVVHEVVQQALRVGKRVHAETGIDHAGASVVTEALADAERVLDGLAGRRALIVGAGSMAGLAAAHLRRAGIGEVVVANRTTANGERLAALSAAEGTPARAVPLTEVVGELAAADLLVACTGAVESVVDVAMVAEARDGRTRPLVVCDLGLPRDVDPAVGELPGVTVVDLETLRRRLREAPAGADTRRAAELVAEGVRAYLAAQRSAEVTPTVTALRRRAAEVVDAELLRLDSRLPELDATVRDELARTVRRVVDKLLHTPTVRVKELAAAPGGSSYADALRELFGLDSTAPAALTAPRTVDHGQDGDKR